MRSVNAASFLLLASLGLATAFVPQFAVLGSATKGLLGLRSTSSTALRMQSSCEGRKRVDEASVSRRSALIAAAATTVLAPLQKAGAAEAAAPAGSVVDSERGFSFTPPSGWNKGTAKFPGADRNPARPEIISYVSPDNKDVNLAIVSYSIQPDYQKLGSLGTIDDVARTILGTSGNLDAEMFSQKEKGVGNGPAYIFDYRIKDKHLLTVFTTQAGEFAGTWLVTLTLQAPSADWDKNKEVLEQTLKSFSLVKR